MNTKTDWTDGELLGFGSGARTSTAKVGKDNGEIIIEAPRSKS